MTTVWLGCSGDRILASPESQLSSSQRSSLLAAAVLYTSSQQHPRFKSQMEYTAYKKAQIVANSTQDKRPIQSTIVSQLREFQSGVC